MKKLMFVAAASLALAACEDKGQSALVQSCVSGGLEKRTCDCLARESKKSMDKEVYEAMVLDAQGKSAEANALMEKMPVEKRFTAATGIVGAMGACAINPK